MQLSKLQRRFLELYRRLHAKPPTAFGMFAMLAPSYIPSTLLFGTAVVLVSINPSLRPIAFLIVGLMLGIAISAFKHIAGVMRAWPVMNDVLDWERINELLENGAVGQASKRPQECPHCGAFMDS